MDTIGAANPVAARTGPERFPRWAGNALLFFLVITAIAAVAVLGAGPRGLVPVALVTAALSIGVLVTVIRGLRAGSEWAVPAAIAVLWLIAAQGVLETLAKLSQGSINVPIGTIIALVALHGAPAPAFVAPRGRAGRTLNAIIVAFVAAAVLPATVVWAYGPSAPWSVGPDAIRLSVELDCPTATPARTLTGAVEWTWTQADLLTPLELDVVIVEFGSPDLEASTLHIHFDRPYAVDAMSADVPRYVMDRSFDDRSAILGIDLGRQGQRAGRATFSIDAQEAMDMRPVSVSATYVHGNRWHVASYAPDCNQ